jgi:molybdopterin/thiamine biosynthesis adenylyltransferase
MAKTFTGSQTSIQLEGRLIPGALDRQTLIPGFDQEAFSKAKVVCVGAGGIVSHIAPTLVRKGIGGLTILDDDVVEESNLNRQRFYPWDVGHGKAVALAENLHVECIAATVLRGIGLRFEEAIVRGIDLNCDVAICGVDNNPARVCVGRYFRRLRIPVIFAAVSRDADHGYVFVQERRGPCIGCLFPDIATDDRFPCPGTPAIADVLQAVGSLAVYAADTLVTKRARAWNYRRVSLATGVIDGCSIIPKRFACSVNCTH